MILGCFPSLAMGDSSTLVSHRFDSQGDEGLRRHYFLSKRYCGSGGYLLSGDISGVALISASWWVLQT